MSTGSSSARNSHLAQWERTTMKPYLRTDLFIGEQNIIIKKTTTQPLKEGVTTIFTVVYLYLDSIFCDHFILHCHIILFTGMNIIVVRSP